MGNRQGGKMPPRPDFSYQQKHSKRSAEKVDGPSVDVDILSPELHAAVFLSTGVHCGGTFFTSPNPALHTQVGGGVPSSTDSEPNFVSMMVQEENHVVSCLPNDRGPVDRRVDFPAADGGGNTCDVTCSQTAFHSPSSRRREVLKPSNFPNDRDLAKGDLTAPHGFSGISSSPSFPKHRCLEADPLIIVGDGVNSLTAVTNLAAACIDRLDHLKRNIEQRNTENVTHFNNTGFAQLQCEAGYDDYDNTNESKGSDARAHRRSKSMSPKTAFIIGAPQLDDKTKSTAVRKLSEPGHFVHRKNSTSFKSIVPGDWSKSAENSPVIVRKALPNPGSPLIVQRTPSQSPSVERRFPANSPASCVVSGNGSESVDSLKLRQHVYHKLAFPQQDCFESRDASHSIRQKATAEISLPHVSTSPVSVRKMPEGPVLVSSGIQHQGKEMGREQPSSKTTGDCRMLDWTPVGTYRWHCMKKPTLSSCSSSSSENPNGKLPSQEDNISPSIPFSTSPTSSSPATPCSSSPTPILFCPQPKGTPIRTCTMVSQPSTAVVLASRESRESLQAVEMRMQPGHSDSGDQNTTAQLYDCKETQASSTSSSSTVTEDTIKQNSQSAVFGSVSPKLLRHRRLIKNNSNHSHDQHTFPKQSQSIHITTAKTSPRKGENSVLGIGDTACTDSCEHMRTNSDESLAQLSQSAPSSFSSHGSSISSSCMGNKTLGQRIREVINEATVGTSLNRETSSVSFRKQITMFSKDNIFTSASVKSSLHSNKSTDKSQKLICDPNLPVGNDTVTGLTGKRREAKTAEEHRTKLQFSRVGTKDTIQDTFPTISGHSYHLNSSRDSCASCVSDSSQMDSCDGTCFPSEVAELTQANLCHQTEWFKHGTRSKQQVVLSAQLEVPGHRLVTSDTSDTLSTDRDTSSSSKRESSTSTATDDTLTSFKTRSTADSADYDEGFVLPESLVFIRSTDRDAQSNMCGFDSEQTTIKRKLVQGHLPELRAEHDHLPHKTRKKRRKQLHVQSQIITATHPSTEGTQTRNCTVREVYSDAISDDSDLFNSKDDISDLPSSRDDISDLPSSRDDISDVLSSRDDISDLPSSRDDISGFPRRKTNTPGGINIAHESSDSGAINRYVFHRSDLHSSQNPTRSSPDESRSRVRKPERHYDTSTELSDNDTLCSFHRRSSSSQGSCASLSKTPVHVGDSGTLLSESHDQLVTSGTRSEAAYPAVLSAHSPRCGPRSRPSAAPHTETSQTVRAEERDSCEQTRDTSICPHDDDDDKGKRLLLQGSESPRSKNTVVLSYTIYNSACQSVGASDLT